MTFLTIREITRLARVLARVRRIRTPEENLVSHPGRSSGQDMPNRIANAMAIDRIRVTSPRR